jgi:hypothetical protein
MTTTDQLKPLAPLARTIADTVRDTPVRLASAEGAADLVAALTVRVAAYVGSEMPAAPGLAGFMAQVDVERRATFGEQQHPDLDPRDIDVVTHHYNAGRAAIWREVNAERATDSRTVGRCGRCPDGPHTHTAWDGLLLEQAYEVAAQDERAALRASLVRMAALCSAWVHDLDSRR